MTALDAGHVIAITPSNGRLDTRVTITGVGMLGGASGLASLVVANVTIPNERVSFASDNAIIFTLPLSSAVAGVAIITADSGAEVTSSMEFEFIHSIIDSISPISGQLGTKITILGTNLMGGGSAVIWTYRGVILVARIDV